MFLWCQELWLTKNYETSYGSKTHIVLKSVVLSVGANSLLYNFAVVLLAAIFAVDEQTILCLCNTCLRLSCASLNNFLVSGIICGVPQAEKPEHNSNPATVSQL